MVEPTSHLDVFAAGEEIVDGCALPCQSNLRPKVTGMTDDVVSEHGCASRSWAEQCGQNANEGSFAGAVRTEQAHDRAATNLEINVFEGNYFAVGFRDLLDFDGVVHVAVPEISNCV